MIIDNRVFSWKHLQFGISKCTVSHIPIYEQNCFTVVYNVSRFSRFWTCYYQLANDSSFQYVTFLKFCQKLTEEGVQIDVFRPTVVGSVGLPQALSIPRNTRSSRYRTQNNQRDGFGLNRWCKGLEKANCTGQEQDELHDCQRLLWLQRCHFQWAFYSLHGN